MPKQNLKISKKEEIKNKVMEYSANGLFDISQFRKEQSKMYATIPYYFGTIDSMLEQFGLIKVQKQSKNKVSLRNKLAYDHLKLLREKYTMEEIAKQYNVSRALISQQIQALDLLMGIERAEEKMN